MKQDGQIGVGRSKKLDRRGFRKSVLIFAIVLLLLVVWIGLVRDRILRGPAKSALDFRMSKFQEVTVPEKPTFLLAPAPPPLETNVLDESRPSLQEKSDVFYMSPASRDAMFIFGNTGRVAIIDVTRIAEALPIATTPEEKAAKIAKIKNAVALVAVAHNLTLVFDSTAMTRSDSLVFPYSEGTSDITALVLQTMNSFSNQTGTSNVVAAPDQGVNRGRF